MLFFYYILIFPYFFSVRKWLKTTTSGVLFTSACERFTASDLDGVNLIVLYDFPAPPTALLHWPDLETRVTVLLTEGKDANDFQSLQTRRPSDRGQGSGGQQSVLGCAATSVTTSAVNTPLAPSSSSSQRIAPPVNSGF